MRVTGISLVPPADAAANPALTPELLASVLARYSRSNEGLEAILGKVDLTDPAASIERILKFVDYGHASIGGLTGGIALAVDGVSMWLAYKLFEFSPMADGQESSSRYITLSAEGLPNPAELGIPEDLREEWLAVAAGGFAAYAQENERLDRLATEEPGRVRAPAGAKPAVLARLRKNYALDRSRYFIPLATLTNVALVQSARMWALTVRQLDSLPQLEARACAAAIRAELMKFAPRLMRHSFSEPSFAARAGEELAAALELGAQRLSFGQLEDRVWVALDRTAPDFLPPGAGLAEAFGGRSNRYSQTGLDARRARVAFAWNNLALAEARDLNRHRTGHRWNPLVQAGFYLPGEIDRVPHAAWLERQSRLVGRLIGARSPAYVYCLFLGSQSPFEHCTQLDKFIYEAELRTGLGAHFRYAQHLSAALAELYRIEPDLRAVVQEGTAEPE